MDQVIEDWQSAFSKNYCDKFQFIYKYNNNDPYIGFIAYKNGVRYYGTDFRENASHGNRLYINQLTIPENYISNENISITPSTDGYIVSDDRFKVDMIYK